LYLSRFGGTTAAGYFEYANKLVFQLRALIVGAHSALVPTLADLQERSPERLRDVYRLSFRLVFFLVAGALPFFLALLPLVGWALTGTYVPDFLIFGVLLFVAWFLNMLANPAYYERVGSGDLRWNGWGHAFIAVLNVALGALGGWLFGGIGVVAAFTVALLSGSALIAGTYQREHAIPLKDVMQRRSLLVGAAGLAGLSAAVAVYAGLG